MQTNIPKFADAHSGSKPGRNEKNLVILAAGTRRKSGQNITISKKYVPSALQSAQTLFVGIFRSSKRAFRFSSVMTRISTFRVPSKQAWSTSKYNTSRGKFSPKHHAESQTILSTHSLEYKHRSICFENKANSISFALQIRVLSCCCINLDLRS